MIRAVSASLPKQLSMQRTRLRKKNPSNINLINYNNQIHHYSTMNSNDRHYFRNAPSHFQHNVNISRSTWHNHPDEIALKSFRNNAVKSANDEDVIIPNSRKQHLNQVNNNFIIEIDQVNGNHLSRLHH